LASDVKIEEKQILEENNNKNFQDQINWKDRGRLVLSILKNMNYKSNMNLINISPPFFIFYKVINRDEYVIIDIILMRLIKKLEDISIEMENEIFKKAKSIQDRIINYGLKVSPNSKNITLSFFKILDYFSLKQSITYYQINPEIRKQQIYRIQPILIYLDGSSPVKWENRIELKICKCGIDSLRKVLTDRFDELVSQDNNIRDKKIHEKILTINYKIEKSWVIYLIISLLITSTNYYINYSSIISSLFSPFGFIIAFITIYSACIGSRILQYFILKKELQGELIENAYSELEASSIIVEDSSNQIQISQEINFNKQQMNISDFHSNSTIKKDEIKENIGHYKQRFKNNYLKFRKALLEKDIINLRLLLPKLLETSVAAAYSATSSEKISDVEKMYQKLFLNRHEDMLQPKIFNYIYRMAKNGSFSYQVFDKLIPKIIKIFKTCGMIIPTKINSLNSDNNFDKHIFFKQVEQIFKEQHDTPAEKILDYILAAVIEKQYGSAKVSDLSFYRDIIKRPIVEGLNWKTRAMLLLMSDYKDIILNNKFILELINKGENNASIKQELFKLWNDLKSSIWNLQEGQTLFINIEDGQFEFKNVKTSSENNLKEIIPDLNEQKKVNELSQTEHIIAKHLNDEENSISLEKNELIYAVNEKIQLTQNLDPIRDFDRYYILGFEAIKILLDYLIAKNYEVSSKIPDLVQTHKLLTEKGYQLINEEQLKRFQFFYEKIKEKKGTIGFSGRKEIIDALIDLYEKLTLQIEGPLKYPKNDKKSPQTIETQTPVNLVENTTSNKFIAEYEDSLELNKIAQNNTIETNTPDQKISGNAGVMLAHFDNNKGYLPKYNIDTASTFNDDILKKIASSALSFKNIEMFSFTIPEYSGKIYGKRFIIPNEQNRGGNEIYALIIYTDEDQEIDDQIFDSTILKLKSDITNTQILNALFDDLFIRKSYPENTNNPAPILIPDKNILDNSESSKFDIPPNVVGLATQQLEDLIESKSFAAIYFINLMVPETSKYFNDFIKACEFFKIIPYYYDTSAYPNSIIRNAYAPCFVIIENESQIILDLENDPIEKLDQLRRILDEHDRNIDQEVNELNEKYQNIPISPSKITFKNTNYLENLIKNHVYPELLEIYNATNEELNLLYKLERDNRKLYDPRYTSQKFLIYFAKDLRDFHNINDIRNYLIVKRISAKFGFDMFYTVFEFFVKTTPKLPDSTPPSVYICKKEDILKIDIVEIKPDNTKFIEEIINKIFNLNLKLEQSNPQIPKKNPPLPPIKDLLPKNTSEFNTEIIDETLTIKSNPNNTKFTNSINNSMNFNYSKIKLISNIESLPRFLQKISNENSLIIFCNNNIFNFVNQYLNKISDKLPPHNFICISNKNQIIFTDILNISEDNYPLNEILNEKTLISSQFNPENFKEKINEILLKIS